MDYTEIEQRETEFDELEDSSDDDYDDDYDDDEDGPEETDDDPSISPSDGKDLFNNEIYSGCKVILVDKCNNTKIDYGINTKMEQMINNKETYTVDRVTMFKGVMICGSTWHSKDLIVIDETKKETSTPFLFDIKDLVT